MANKPKATGTSRIKFIMFDAEIADDQIPMVTQAITNALRGPNPAPMKRLPPTPQLNGHAEEPEEPDLFDQPEGDDAIEVAPKPRASTPRKAAPTPEVLDIDLTSQDVPLATFVSEHKSESHQQRYLVASAWYQEHGGVTKITPAHIYTAYRHLKWPLTVKDFGQALRDMKSDQLYNSPEKGAYTLKHLGLQRVSELKIAKAD